MHRPRATAPAFAIDRRRVTASESWRIAGA
jgi:hypothetical protein